MKKLFARKPSYIIKKVNDRYILYRYDARASKYQIWQRFDKRADAAKVAAERRRLGI